MRRVPLGLGLWRRGRRRSQGLAAGPRPQSSGVTSVSPADPADKPHARMEERLHRTIGTWDLGPGFSRSHERTKTQEGRHGGGEHKPVQVTSLWHPVLLRASQDSWPCLPLDGTKADVSSPSGCHWVSGREDASTRTAKRWGWGWFCLAKSLRYGGAGGGGSLAYMHSSLCISRGFEARVEETVMYS